MVRPRKNCHVMMSPTVEAFQPKGVRFFRREPVSLAVDEWEALRLADVLGLNQKEAGALMEVSRSTFGRILGRARTKVADALVHGKAIHIGRVALPLERT